MSNPISEGRVPTVKGNLRLLLTPPAQPKKRGKPPEQYAAELHEYHKAYRAFLAHNAAIRRERAMALGITEYIWVKTVTIGCGIACRNNGKVFSYANPPPEGHPQEGECDDHYCRCSPRNVIPGLTPRIPAS